MITYFMVTKGAPFVKIGKATQLARRLVNIQVGCPFVLVVWKTLDGDREREEHFNATLITRRLSGEWFYVSRDLVNYYRERFGTTDYDQLVTLISEEQRTFKTEDTDFDLFDAIESDDSPGHPVQFTVNENMWTREPKEPSEKILPRQEEVLAVIKQAEDDGKPLHVVALAKTLGMTTQGAQRMVARLELRQAVVREDTRLGLARPIRVVKRKDR